MCAHEHRVAAGGLAVGWNPVSTANQAGWLPWCSAVWVLIYAQHRERLSALLAGILRRGYASTCFPVFHSDVMCWHRRLVAPLPGCLFMPYTVSG